MKKKIVVLAVVTAVVIASLAVAYYFTIFLPKAHNLEMQEKCAKLAREYVNDMRQDPNIIRNYECHYNERLNKHFILLKTSLVNWKIPKMSTSTTLIDILNRKEYATITAPPPFEDTPSTGQYWLEGKQCSPEEWNKGVNKYMEE